MMCARSAVELVKPASRIARDTARTSPGVKDARCLWPMVGTIHLFTSLRSVAHAFGRICDCRFVNHSTAHVFTDTRLLTRAVGIPVFANSCCLAIRRRLHSASVDAETV